MYQVCITLWYTLYPPIGICHTTRWYLPYQPWIHPKTSEFEIKEGAKPPDFAPYNLFSRNKLIRRKYH